MKIIALTLVLVACFTLVSAQSDYVQEGQASFYADKFEGRITASGERYSHSKSTCAHLSLPFGTLVKVTNLSNNLSVVCRVNDRGPFVPDRIIDLSRSVAEKLDFFERGIVDVRIEVVEDPSTGQPTAAATTTAPRREPQKQQEPQRTEQPASAPPAEPTHAPQPQPKPRVQTVAATGEFEYFELEVSKVVPIGYTVQIASYRELANLFRFTDEIKSALSEQIRVQVATVNGEKIYRLMAGQFATRDEAESFQRRASRNYPDCFVMEFK